MASQESVRNFLKSSPKSSKSMFTSRSSSSMTMNRVLCPLMMTILMSAVCLGESKLESLSTKGSVNFDSSNKSPLTGHLMAIEKRSTGNQELDGLSEPGQRETIFIQPILPDLGSSDDLDLEQFVGEEKRSPSRYSFGIGKRNELFDYDLDPSKRYDWNRYSSNKRLPASRYNFGIGKKSRYNFGIGKRIPSQRYSFGIGK